MTVVSENHDPDAARRQLRADILRALAIHADASLAPTVRVLAGHVVAELLRELAPIQVLYAGVLFVHDGRELSKITLEPYPIEDWGPEGRGGMCRWRSGRGAGR